MTLPSPPPSAGDLSRSLGRTRIAMLATLGAAALASLLMEGRPNPPPGQGLNDPWTIAALALGLASILARRTANAPNTPAPRRVTLTIAAWALAGGLGIVGLASGIARGDPRSGLLFILAGAIFCLAAPVPRLPDDGGDAP